MVIADFFFPNPFGMCGINLVWIGDNIYYYYLNGLLLADETTKRFITKRSEGSVLGDREKRGVRAHMKGTILTKPCVPVN